MWFSHLQRTKSDLPLPPVGTEGPNTFQPRTLLEQNRQVPVAQSCTVALRKGVLLGSHRCLTRMFPWWRWCLTCQGHGLYTRCTGASAAALAVMGVVLAAWLSTSRRSGAYQELRGRVFGCLAWASRPAVVTYGVMETAVAWPCHCLKRDRRRLSNLSTGPKSVLDLLSIMGIRMYSIS